MKTVLFLLLAIYLFASTVVSLQCYSCTNAASNTVCNQKPVVNCSAGQDRCMVSKVTTELLGQQTSTLTKGCTENSKCTGTITVLFISGGTDCCKTDLCNVNGSVIISESKLMLIASAIFLHLIHKLAN